jgi:ubiquinone/menaquinone biosynthesis C-methylase UbiE
LIPAAEQVASELPFPTHRDRDFFNRVYQTPRQIYVERLRAIGFAGRESVLDAACGFGQWSLALASLNTRVYAFDLSDLRIRVLHRLAAVEQASNLTLCRSSLDRLPYADRSFDALFCYGAVFFTDYRRSLAEFARVLKPGGLLYFTANDIGWYLYNLIAAHKPSRDFSPRRMATRALFNTVRFKIGIHAAGDEIAISRGAARRAVDAAGFSDISIAGDGQVTRAAAVRGRPFFASHYLRLPAVYEVLCERR